MRDVIAAAILKAFSRSYEQHGCNYDPDTCYEAADEVVAALVSRLTGEPYEAKFGHYIGHARIVAIEAGVLTTPERDSVEATDV